MKIDGIKKRPISSKSVKKKASSPQDISFKSLLDGQIQPVSETESASEMKGVQGNSSAPASIRLSGLALSEKTIDVLAAFGEALDNRALNLGDLQPIVEALENETTAILDVKEQLAADDPLAELLDRVAAIAYLESEKYRRGDYGS